MASDTVPAAAHGPNTPPDGTPGTASGTQPASPSGGLSGLLAPVPPARATFNLNPDAAADGVTESAGVSSADYHAQKGQENVQNSTATGTSGKQQQSIWRAWILAGAERWKKGADARNKALDIKKARAQALQVKETRTVNRSEKHVGGGTSTGASTNSNSGKSLNSKSSNAGKGSSGAKNSNGAGTSGRGTSPGRSGANGNSGTGGQGGGAGRTPGNGGGHASAGRRSTGGGKANTSGPGSKSSGSGKDTSKPFKPANGGKHQPGPSGSKGGNGSTSGGGKSSGKGGAGTPRSSSATGSRGTAGKDGKPSKDAPARTDSTKAKDAKDTGGHDKPRKVDLDKKPDAKTRPDNGKPAPATSKKTTSPTPTGKTPRTATGTGKPLNVQESRETGYRDGVRAATVAAHVDAWRDGVRDGWNDRKADAAHEKARLDQAHANRTQPNQPQPQKVPPMPTHAPTAHLEPQPIQVTAVTEDGVGLGTGADRSHIGHGEVRRLKDYERKMTVKADTMARIAEGSRGLKEHAEQQLKHVTFLTEQARIVEGGTALLETLTKLQEDAHIQASLADEVVRRAARSAEACNVLLTNVETRYGSIYKAVVDSGLIKPAHLRYYEDAVNA